MRNFITTNDVDMAVSAGKRELSLGPEDVLTAMAKEQAQKLGVRITFRDHAGPAAGAAGLASGGSAGSASAGTFVPGFISGGSSTVGRSAGSAGGNSPAGYNIEAWRKRIPILSREVHVANCSHAPQSDMTLAAAQEYLTTWDQVCMAWDRYVEVVGEAKAEFAKMIGAEQDEIAVGTSLSELTSTIASALPMNGPRKKVVVTEAEFPTVGHVWLAHQKFGINVQYVPLRNGQIDPSDYDRIVDNNTLITSICDVFYYNGFKQKLADIIPRIHAKESLVYVDAYQGLGTHPIDVKALDIDFLASGNLKYLMGTPGIAFLYVKRELIPYLKPAFTGWFGQEDPFSFDVHHLDFARDARRFDNGTPPAPTAYIAKAGMQIINEVGPANIQAWTDQLSRRCLEGAQARGLEVASPLDVALKAPTTAIRVPGDSHHVEHELRQRKIIASARADVIRIAPHFFTRLDEIDYVLDNLAEIVRS